MPEALQRLVAGVRTRLRARVLAHALTVGGAVFALLLTGSLSVAASAAAASIAGFAVAARRWRIGTRTIAHVIERHQSLDNLLITAAELDEQPRPLPAEIRDAIRAQAADRSVGIASRHVVPLMQPAIVAVAVLVGCVLLARIGDVSQAVQYTLDGAGAAAPASNAITVRVTPPLYTKTAPQAYDSPAQVTVIAGSQVRIEAASRVLREWTATASESLELQVHETAAPRFLAVTVIPDAPPSLRVMEPGRDVAFASSSHSLRLAIDAQDDLGLSSVVLRYTKASGGGENVTFTEGEVPLSVGRVSERHWRAQAVWALEGLGLAEGDVLVYRAVARDLNPNGSAAESDAYLVEIGRTAEIASAGFALPTEERKYAISQQMVIYKTEQLLRLRQTAGEKRFPRPEDWLEQTRMIGIEQRMVRAEVVFLSGGDVQDEVEEAAHSHELAEGRLENQGRAEMVRALSFMSRAEAQLNDGNAAEALVFERQALASLERALDRRRYFLRTLPDRSRIDMTRRLTGERGEARSWVRSRADAPARPAVRAQAAMRELVAALADQSLVTASLAARVGAIDPASPELQKAAVAIAGAPSGSARQEAVQAAMAAVTAHALKTLPGSSNVTLPSDPLAGRLGDAIAGRPR